MAGRIDSNRIIRMIHLVSSVILLVFLTMYTITGIVVTHHHSLPEGERTVTNSELILKDPMKGSPQIFAKELKRNYGFHGRGEYRQLNDGRWEFYFSTPGTRIKATLNQNGRTLGIETTRVDKTLLNVSRYLHGLRGFSGGWIYSAWAVLYDLAAFAMVLFGITGILMWFGARKWYPSGWWYLTIGTLIPLAIIFAFLFSK